MSGPLNCTITLDNPYNTYYPGQTVQGKVEYIFEEIKKVKAIYIRFRGAAETKWTEHKSREGTSTLYIPYSASEEYFNVKYDLQGGTSTDEVIEFKPGKHTFPFNYVLPLVLPTSFEGDYGYVRYTIQVVSVRPWAFDEEIKMAFTVIGHMDLNITPGAELPIDIRLQKSFYCWYCTSGPLTVDVHLPASGFVPGQPMPIDITCENGSRVTVRTIAIKLKKYVIFHSDTPIKFCKYSIMNIGTVTTEAIPGHTTKNFSTSLTVPPVPPSYLQNCRIIDLSYQLKVHCKLSMQLDLIHDNLLTIGTVPLIKFESSITEKRPVESNPEKLVSNEPYETQPMFNPSLPDTAVNSSVLPDTAVKNPAAMYPQLGLPIFKPGQFSGNIAHSDDSKCTQIVGDGEFAPCYPTYGFNIPPK